MNRAFRPPAIGDAALLGTIVVVRRVPEREPRPFGRIPHLRRPPERARVDARRESFCLHGMDAVAEFGLPFRHGDPWAFRAFPTFAVKEHSRDAVLLRDANRRHRLPERVLPEVEEGIGGDDRQSGRRRHPRHSVCHVLTLASEDHAIDVLREHACWVEGGLVVVRHVEDQHR